MVGLLLLLLLRWYCSAVQVLSVGRWLLLMLMLVLLLMLLHAKGKAQPLLCHVRPLLQVLLTASQRASQLTPPHPRPHLRRPNRAVLAVAFQRRCVSRWSHANPQWRSYRRRWRASAVVAGKAAAGGAGGHLDEIELLGARRGGAAHGHQTFDILN